MKKYIFLPILAISACSTGDNTADIASDNLNNQSPIIDLPDKRIVTRDTAFNLDASESYDPDGDSLTFEWRLSYSDGGWSLISNDSVVSFTAESTSVDTDTSIDSFDEYYPPFKDYMLTLKDSRGASSEQSIRVYFVPNLVDNGDGTISSSYGVMWQKNSHNNLHDSSYSSPIGYLGEFNLWNNACENLDLAGYSDWRVPTLRILSILVDATREPAIDVEVFSDDQSYQYGTSTVYGGISGAAISNYVYNFSESVRPISDRNLLSSYIRCARW